MCTLRIIRKRLIELGAVRRVYTVCAAAVALARAGGAGGAVVAFPEAHNVFRLLPPPAIVILTY